MENKHLEKRRKWSVTLRKTVEIDYEVCIPDGKEREAKLEIWVGNQSRKYIPSDLQQDFKDLMTEAC